jgi:hypothetical protein
MNIVEIENVIKTFRKVKAVDSLFLQVPPGSIFCLFGLGDRFGRILPVHGLFRLDGRPDFSNRHPDAGRSAQAGQDRPLGDPRLMRSERS